MTEAQDKILYCLQEGNVESETLSMSGMESFVEKQTKLLEMQPTKAPEKDPEQPPKGYVDSCLSDAAVPAQDPSNSDPGEWRGLCSHGEGSQGGIHLGLGIVGVCNFDFYAIQLSMLCVELQC